MSENAITPEQRLAQIDDAIQAIMIAGQEYSHEGRRVRRAELSVLYMQRQHLAAQISEAAGGNTTVVVFEGR